MVSSRRVATGTTATARQENRVSDLFLTQHTVGDTIFENLKQHAQILSWTTPSRGLVRRLHPLIQRPHPRTPTTSLGHQLLTVPPHFPGARRPELLPPVGREEPGELRRSAVRSTGRKQRGKGSEPRRNNRKEYFSAVGTSTYCTSTIGFCGGFELSKVSIGLQKHSS